MEQVSDIPLEVSGNKSLLLSPLSFFGLSEALPGFSPRLRCSLSPPRGVGEGSKVLLSKALLLFCWGTEGMGTAASF